MNFKRIEIQGFKSFADPVTIELNDGITCIIGPNGSGKSNISDALRWVIGEQSSRQLRGNKMQDVIFAGTSTRKPKGMAEVTLVIDNSNGVLPLEYNEVAVTRRLYRSGEGEYLINGNPCRLRDVKELFMDTGIGVDGYSIIGQGKISDIVSSKTDSRRQIFEEAAGVVLYKTRKAEAESKLKSASDNIERVQDIIGEIESRIGGLKEDSEKATEYISLRDRYQKLGVNILLHNIQGLEKSVAIGKTELEDFASKIDNNTARIDELDALIENKMLADSSLQEELNESTNSLLAKIDELNTINNSGELTNEKLSNIEKDLTRLNESVAELNEKLSLHRSQYDELMAKDKELTADKESVENDYNNAVVKLNSDTIEYNNISQEIENAKNDIIEQKNKAFSGNKDISTLEDYCVTLAARKSELESEFCGDDTKESRNKAELLKIANDLDKKEQILQQTKEEFKSIDDNILSDNNLMANMSAEINDLNDKMSRISSRKNTIEEMEANYEGYNNAVRSLMRKSFRGIIGTVSDLITVPSGYELAIETALGAALQNIVCEDDSSAKAAVNWLKSAKAGRATFLPLNSIRVNKYNVEQAVTKSDGFIGIASDIVNTDSKFNIIKDHLLGRVIVADNMDNAVALSKQRIGGFRIVTLDGEIISSNGAITGGRYANKSANLLDRKKEIETLSSEIEQLTNKTQELKSRRYELVDQIKEKNNYKDDLSDKLQKLAIEFNVLKADKDHAETIVSEESMRADKYANELKAIEEDIKNTESVIDTSKAEVALSAERISEIETNLESLLNRYDEFKLIIEDENERIIKARLKLTEQDTRIYAQNELVERERDLIMDIESQLEDDNNNIMELEKTRDLLTSTGVASSEKKDNLANEKQTLENRIDELNHKISSNQVEHSNYTKERKEFSELIDSLKDEKYKLDLKTTRNETLLETQKDKLWEEFEVSYIEALDMRDENFAITSGNREAKEIKLRMAELGDVNVSSIEEYKQVSKRYEFLTAQESDTARAMKELDEIITNMDITIKRKFKETFDEVVINFEEAFQELFGGGHAELTLDDESNVLESAIEITAQPPGKKLKNINLLSGGEKTLTAIALMCAVLKAKPTPFVILDEVEAALDEVNIERFSGYLRKFNEIQFTLITHQKATMEHADVLYGVTMPEQGISKMLSLKLGDDISTDEFQH